jgi:short-subunit dehydrogenase
MNEERKNMMKLQNKVVLVTGGSGGLGEQICYEAAKKGATVVVCARRRQEIREVQARCQILSSRRAYAYELDVANPTSVETVIELVKQEIGHIDVLVNNAGFGLFENFLDFDLACARQMFEVNILGLMSMTQQVALMMAEQKHGHIINIASMAGKMATNKSTVYSATKFAVIGFSNALRLELKPLNIAVTTVNPGPVATKFFEKADPTGNYLAALGNVVLDANHLAQTIVNSMGTKRREINKPGVMQVAAQFYTLFPHVGDLLAGSIFNQK